MNSSRWPADADAADRQAAVDHIGMVHALSLRQAFHQILGAFASVASHGLVQTYYTNNGSIYNSQ